MVPRFLFAAGLAIAAAHPILLAESSPLKPLPDRPLSESEIVLNNAVAAKNGKPIDGLKLSQHDIGIFSPSIAVGPDGKIHVAFVETHPNTFALAVYYRSSGDHGKTWTEAKNLSEDMPDIAVGRSTVLVDGRNRIYVIWRAGMGQYLPASSNLGGSGPSNLMYRVLENGKWSSIKPVHPPATNATQDRGSLSSFTVVDGAGRVQVIWNVVPQFLASRTNPCQRRLPTTPRRRRPRASVPSGAGRRHTHPSEGNLPHSRCRTD